MPANEAPRLGRQFQSSQMAKMRVGPAASTRPGSGTATGKWVSLEGLETQGMQLRIRRFEGWWRNRMG